MTDETSELLETVRCLKDRQDILDCLMREVRGRDRHDVELTASCYWPEGFDEHGPHITLAADYPARANAGPAAFFSATSHNITNHTCEIDWGCGALRDLCRRALLSKDRKTCTIALGRYLDRLEKRDGEWRIMHRRCTVDMSIEGSAEWLESDAIKGFLKPVWDQSDISYQRPIEVGSDGAHWGKD